MWLINTESLELENFIGDDIPGYAILSHTWGDEEVTFQDWQDPEKRSQKAGFAKIDSACAQAQADSLNYIWVDTNCINKFSSAELSEAINSMFAWYKNSYTCYVYFADVEDPDNVAGNLRDDTEELDWDNDFERRNSVENIKKARFKDSLRRSRWFTRGWTLQELLAPRSIRFFTKEWKPISMELERYHSIHSRLPEHDMHPKGLKRDNRQEPLLRLLSDITGIRLDVLSYPENAVSCSNAEKMSWIADRETTREEDIAYCLLGIFDINMPLLYGEGSKAFRRLQEEIIKQSTDHSLFAWQWPQNSLGMKGRQPNLFADSAKLFSGLNTNLLGYGLQFDMELNEYDPLSTIITLTNFGLSINLELIPTADLDYVFGVLNIATNKFQNPKILSDRELWCIPLQKMGPVYYRAPFPPGPILVRTRRKRTVYPIHIPRTELYFSGHGDYLYQYAFLILFPDLDIGDGFQSKSLGQIGDVVFSPHRSTVSIPLDSLQNGKIAACILSIECSEACSFVLLVGAREVNSTVESAVRLFPAGTSMETVVTTQMTFRPPSFYWNECRPFSLVVSKGHRVDPLIIPNEYGIQSPPGHITIFSISLYVDQDAAQPESMEIFESESEEASEASSETTADSESNVSMS